MGNMKNTRNPGLLSPSVHRRNGGAVVSIVSALLVAGEAGEVPAPAGKLGGLRPIPVPATTARLEYPYCHLTYSSENAWLATTLQVRH